MRPIREAEKMFPTCLGKAKIDMAAAALKGQYSCNIFDHSLSQSETREVYEILSAKLVKHLRDKGFKVGIFNYKEPWEGSDDERRQKLMVSWDKKGTVNSEPEPEISSQERLDQIRAEIYAWDSKKGHDRCWYYPDIFKKIASAAGVTLTKEPTLPSRAEFEKGCCKYQEEQFGKKKSRKK